MDAQFNKLKEILSMVINELKLKDYYLLEKDVNERSITHKLAGYLQKHLSEHFDEHYDVDCEYNRNGRGRSLMAPPDDRDASDSSR